MPDAWSGDSAVSAGCAREAERAEPIVDRDDDDVALIDQPCRVVVVALAGDQRAAVDPHHDRAQAGSVVVVTIAAVVAAAAVVAVPVALVRGEHVEEQAILGGPLA